MAEYIEREATIKLLRSLGSRDYRREKGTIQEAIKMVSFSEYTPAADVAPIRHGRWLLEREPNGKPYCFHCSVCDSDYHYIGIVTASDYCPNCGAKMDGGKNDADN